MKISERLHSLFFRLVLRRAWTAFLVGGLAFLASAAGTINFVYILKANLALVLDYGWQALNDGVARQLVEMLFVGYASLAGFLVFKACEHRLVRGLSQAPPAAPDE
ncbi:MAG: hypothetical protein JO224_03645 [Pelomonas sp.]|nr:hypothetical protein [Roseateles sp.]